MVSSQQGQGGGHKQQGGRRARIWFRGLLPLVSKQHQYGLSERRSHLAMFTSRIV